MKFNIITIFPEIFKSYFKESIVKRAQERGLIEIKVYNLRDFTNDRHKTVDGRPYSGGPGMIFKIEPLYKAVSFIRKKPKKKNIKSRVILFSAKGKKFNQNLAKKLSKIDELILICGRYEGVDERVAKKIADLEISTGDYVLTGGEIPAMVLVDSISRLIPGVIKKESLKNESFSLGKPRKDDFFSSDSLEYPQYTRPEVFIPKKGIFWRVPKVLLSGNHKKIEEWQKKNSKKRKA